MLLLPNSNSHPVPIPHSYFSHPILVFNSHSSHFSSIQVVNLVYDDTELIPTTASTEDLSLSRLCRSNYAFIRQVTVLFLREHGHKTEWGKKCHISKETMTAVLSGIENGVELERESNDIGIFDSTITSSPTTLSLSSTNIPLIVKACICCGILYPHIRRCSGCFRYVTPPLSDL